MLVELVVENYAVVEHVRIRFHDGLNLLTGETGSGKSIVVDALGLLYGGRASADVVRTGSGRARIAGIFEAPETPEFRALIAESGIEIEDGELLIEREVLGSGKSRAFAGSRPVTAALLRELAPHLGDIHGQHDQQELFDPNAQLAMLDGFGAIETGAIAGLHARWQGLKREIEELDRGEQEKLRLADLWSFQKREIEEAGFRPGEDTALEAERRVLMNVARLDENARAAYDALYEAEGSALGAIRTARKRIEELSRIDPALNETLELLKPAEYAVDEASRALQHYLAGLEADPARLDHVETRLAALDKLRRKYGDTVEAILAFFEDVSAKLAAVETAGERRAMLARDVQEAEGAYEKAARKVSAARRKSAQQLESAAHEELASLAMAGTSFRAELTEGEWSARGWDRVRFLMSANKGEEPRPLEKVASGGELSRLALALKTCVAGKGEASGRTLVFDEVDSGVGGRTAESVGRRLKRLAAANQVLCVTHAPQIAGFADHHYVVTKGEVGGRTVAAIEELPNQAARAREIGRMLSGEKMTAEAIKQAEQLIKAGAR
ncbi:MAG: DNA repair protein RecN [Bryobacteraceae bacterium]